MSKGRSRDRLASGTQNDRHGSRGHPRGGIELGRTPVARPRDAVLVNKLAGCKPGERDGIRAYLRRDGSPRAKALLAELERRWAAPPAGLET